VREKIFYLQVVARMQRRGCESIPNFMLLKHVRKNNRLILLNPVSLRDDECGILSQPLRFIQATELKKYKTMGALGTRGFGFKSAKSLLR
jgi:hypothetical protein